ncbi:ATP-dependent DNA family protein [Babesia ovis]|uniref:DNA 3'-5' helicase n=1 Tax=Babesia ovis TaxID=5869 RepID=A0A9W5TAI1_BABOV|nr:ATP-dependent DNA family protein [Babesia ovis]
MGVRKREDIADSLGSSSNHPSVQPDTEPPVIDLTGCDDPVDEAGRDINDNLGLCNGAIDKSKAVNGTQDAVIKLLNNASESARRDDDHIADDDIVGANESNTVGNMVSGTTHIDATSLSQKQDAPAFDESDIAALDIDSLFSNMGNIILQGIEQGMNQSDEQRQTSNTGDENDKSVDTPKEQVCSDQAQQGYSEQVAVKVEPGSLDGDVGMDMTPNEIQNAMETILSLGPDINECQNSPIEIDMSLESLLDASNLPGSNMDLDGNNIPNLGHGSQQPYMVNRCELSNQGDGPEQPYMVDRGQWSIEATTASSELAKEKGYDTTKPQESISTGACTEYKPAKHSCQNKVDESIVGESLSFFAVKHLVALVKAVGECLSADDSTEERWHHVLGLQKRAQMFINEAVKANFEGDDLEQYRLRLPDKLCFQRMSGIVQVVKGDSGVTPGTVARNPPPSTVDQSTNNTSDYTPGLFDDDDDMEHEDWGLDEPSRSSMKRSATSQASEKRTKSDNIAKIRTVGDLNRMSAMAKKEKVQAPKRKKSKTKGVADKQEPGDYDMDDDDDIDYSQGEAGDISHLSDPLAEARMVYMGRVNSNEIAGVDLRVPRKVWQENAQLFSGQFGFSQKVDELNTGVFGYKSFRGVQLAAINAILLGKDCFLMMATGGGKSHCYQLPSMLLGGVVVVFSPLISLMEDQMRVLRSYGLNAETVNANTSAATVRQISKRYLDKNQEFKNGAILFITPEKFDKSAILLRMLDELDEAGRLKLFVIDEVHCVSQWGLSFRKDYRKLCNLKNRFPLVPILAMTATATPDVAMDIIHVLRIPSCVKLRTTINRPNLWIECREKTKTYLNEMIDILKTTTGCGIVYTLTVGDSEKVARGLEDAGISVGTYNARLDIESRRTIQRRWTSGEIRVMVATIAFGMGIDKPDVRFVFHTSAPVSILGYYQEIGRAGRDGKYSTTILWYNLRDFERHKNLGQKITASRGVSGEELSTNPKLSNMREFCQNKSTCRRLLLFRAFGEDPAGVLPPNCGGCDNCCTNLLTERTDVTEDAITICNFVEETMKYRNKGILTMNILCDALRGSNRSTMVKYRLNENSYHGIFKNQKPKYICQVIQEMVNLRILRECRRSCKRFGRTVFVLGPNLQKLRRGQIEVSIISYKHAVPPGLTTEGSSGQVVTGSQQDTTPSLLGTALPGLITDVGAHGGIPCQGVSDTTGHPQVDTKHTQKRMDELEKSELTDIVWDDDFVIVIDKETGSNTDVNVPDDINISPVGSGTGRREAMISQELLSKQDGTSVDSQATPSSETTWRRVSPRSHKLLSASQDAENVDIQAALRNNIRRKLPVDLISSLS